MNRSEQINELATALAKAQAEMKAAPKNATNPAFKREGEGTKYAALPDVIEASRVLAKHGLAFVQPASVADDGAVTVETMLMHSTGQWLSERLSLRPQANTPQGIGSAMTYARRYGLSSFVGIAADEDDDGNEASKSDASKAERPRQQPTNGKPQAVAHSPEVAEALAGIAEQGTRDAIATVYEHWKAKHKANAITPAEWTAIEKACKSRADAILVRAVSA